MSLAIGRLSQFADGKPQKIDFDGEDVLVVRIADEVFAVNDTCTHAEVSLSEGDIVDCSIECWLHGSAFSLRTGEPSGPPAVKPLETYVVTLSDDSDPEIHLAARS